MYSNKLKELRESKDLNLQFISKILRLEKDTYGKFEREYTTIPLKHLNILANYYNVSIDYIFEFNNLPCYQNNINDIDKIIVGQRLKEFRKENNLTQVKLANILNIDHSVITNYEKGKHVKNTTSQLITS